MPHHIATRPRTDIRFQDFQLPPPWPEDVRPRIRAPIAAQPGHKLVVLDDDPTGTQTAHDVPVLTVWDATTLRAEFAQPGPCFYILTDARSLLPEAAASLNRDLARTCVRRRPAPCHSRS
jgi:hypothetical protein